MHTQATLRQVLKVVQQLVHRIPLTLHSRNARAVPPSQRTASLSAPPLTTKCHGCTRHLSESDASLIKSQSSSPPFQTSWSPNSVSQNHLRGSKPLWQISSGT